ncbi:MAG: M20/M25/M40 family metallo-hydrolase [Candidatus Thermoplasmatota archaeon]
MPAALLADLIRAARGGPLAVLARVERELLPMGFTARRTKGEPTAVLFARGAPRFVLSGHVDVVPVGEGWTREPFGGQTAEGRVWGRGASDMLGSVACFVAAARATRSPCAILLTTDEETTMRAAELAIEEGLLSGFDGVVVGEPTSMQVGIAEKGVLWVRVDAVGTNAHGSMPELGDNAVARIVRIADRLANYRPPGKHPLLGEATASLDRIGGGEAVNQVPATAFLELDVRYLPGTSQEDVLRAVRDAVAPEHEKASVSAISSHLPFETSADAPLARAALAAGGRGTVALPYGTEASKYAPAGIPTIILGPGDPAVAHTDHESIAIADLDAGARAYAALLDGVR